MGYESDSGVGLLDPQQQEKLTTYLEQNGHDQGKEILCSETLSIFGARMNLSRASQERNYDGAEVEINGKILSPSLFESYAKIPSGDTTHLEGAQLEELITLELVEETPEGIRHIQNDPECIVKYHAKPTHFGYRNT